MIAEVRSDRGTGPPVVYVPGIDGSGRMLLGTEERLVRRFRLATLAYRIEPGTPPDADSYPALAASVVSCLDEPGLSRALLLAESFGGAVALQAALDHPERIAGLAIVNSFVHYPARLRLWVSRVGLPLVPRRLFAGCRKLLAPYSLFGNLRDDEAVRALLADQFDFTGCGYRRRLRMIAGLDLRGRLREVRQPVALFAGDRDRIVASVPMGRAMASALPDAELEVVRGGGHLLLPLSTLPWEDWLEKLCERAGLIHGDRARGDEQDG